MKPDIPFITVAIPCYNEGAILQNNIIILNEFIKEKSSKYQFEVLIIDDGSNDDTGNISDLLEEEFEYIRVIHHSTNLNLGHALQTGFCNAKGNIIVVLDIDLSYSVTYIEKLADTLIETSADIVLASPYMKGGKVIAVPFVRRMMSKWINKFMRAAAQDKFHTFTGMVRAYRTSFIRSVNLKTRDYDINPEIMYKAMILRARIIEIPACLDWTEQNKYNGKRKSKIRLFKSFFSGLMSAFIFRPYIFFLFTGLLLMFLSLFEIIWLFIDTLKAMRIRHIGVAEIELSFSQSLLEQYLKNPQTFIVGGISLLASLLFLGFGFISLQNKRYFEELFHLGTSLRIRLDNENNNKNL